MEQDLNTVRRAVAGDSDAFVEAADGVKGKLYHTAYVIMGSEAEAMDAVDETLFNAWRSIRSLREPRFFATWITRILINQCNMKLRRRKREMPADRLPVPAGEDFDTLPVRDAVRRLPEDLRMAIGLRYFADMTVPAVAEALSLPEGTVKSRLRKALSLLRVELRD